MPTIVAVSDTHGHEGELPDGDILVHAGDWSGYGTFRDTDAFFAWFAAQPHPTKIVVPGNHDLWCSENDGMAHELFEAGDIHYLCDESLTVNGLRFYGTPQQPAFMQWAFNRSEPELEEFYARIPSDTDILITHTPPWGILDYNAQYQSCGSLALLGHVVRVQPRLHIFGHIHEGYGYRQAPGLRTEFYNVATCTSTYAPNNAPVVITL